MKNKVSCFSDYLLGLINHSMLLHFDISFCILTAKQYHPSGVWKVTEEAF